MALWERVWSYLHLLEVTHSLNGEFALDGNGWVSWLQLNNGLCPLAQAGDLALQLIELLFLLLCSKNCQKSFQTQHK